MLKNNIIVSIELDLFQDHLNL